MSPEPPKTPRSLMDILAGLPKLSEALGPQKESDALSSFASSLFSLSGSPPAISISQIPPPPPPIRDRWFKDQTIQLDGYTFERCRFDQCQLLTKMATFTLRNCYIAPTCRILFDGPALKTVRLLMHILALSGRLPYRSEDAGVYPAGNNDGTFTLE